MDAKMIAVIGVADVIDHESEVRKRTIQPRHSEDVIITNEWKLNKRDQKSRYTDDKRIQLSDGYSEIETHDRVSISQDNSDQFYRVEPGYESRLDLISWKYYDTPLYWWIIAYASNITDPLDVKVGTLLRIPNLSRALREVKK